MPIDHALQGVHTLFILPELVAARARDLRLLILADGNRRHAPGAGYEGGARKVVSIAEHLARRGDVAVLVACILSPENVAKRGDGFFLDLYKQFVRLGVAIETQGALVASGVRVETWGDLGSLRARGGHAEALADAMEAVASMTARVKSPAMRLVLAAGYGSDAARALDVDVVLRTGMEEEGVLRLSGLETLQRIASHATTRLWPEIEPRDVDEVIEAAKRLAAPGFTGGHAAEAIAELAIALSAIDVAAPARVIVPTVAPVAVMADALDRLFAGPLRGTPAIAIEHARGDRIDSYGPGDGARWRIHVARGSASLGASIDAPASVLAPGQRPPLLTLPDWLPLGHANVHGCDAGVRAIVASIRAALRFSTEHPPLRGGDRPIAPRAPSAAPTRPSERDALGDAFAARILEWAASAGLLLASTEWQRAALNYALTGFFMHHRVPTEWDDAAAAWESRAELAARYMLIVSAGDEGIFDRAIEGETPDQRLDRLAISARFLILSARGDGPPAAPEVPDAELLAAIARALHALFERHRAACHPDILESWLAGVESLYTGSVAEHRAGSHRLSYGAGTIINDHLVGAPACVIARARDALRESAAPDRRQGDADELRVLLHLAEVGGAIGAGLLFRTAALAAPASHVTRRRAAVLDAATALLDYPFRLSNDMSGFLDSPGGDRNPKVNACAMLVQPSASGAARAAAVVGALATCSRLAAWLDGEARAGIDAVAEVWPSMGAVLRRGVFVGRRVYEVGHYASVTRAQMSAIFDEAERALAR